MTIDTIMSPGGVCSPPQCGGACLYAALGARLWDTDVGIVSIVSAHYPQEWLDDLASAGIDLSGIRRSPLEIGMEANMAYRPDGSRTSFNTREYPEGMSDEDIHAMQVQIWYDFSPEASGIPDPYYQAVGAHVAPMPLARQTASLRALAGHVRHRTVDLPWWLGTQQRGEYPDLSHTTATLLSEAEVEGYFGDIPPLEAARALAAQGSPIVVVKHGAQGSTIYDAASERSWQIPVYPTTVRDTTGAGDAYCGGFLVGLHETGDPLEAALYGTVSASFVIEEFGALYSLKFTREDAAARLHKLRALLPASSGGRQNLGPRAGGPPSRAPGQDPGNS
jgi:sugar/nucleoside kinase (ribokinase family)